MSTYCIPTLAALRLSSSEGPDDPVIAGTFALVSSSRSVDRVCRNPLAAFLFVPDLPRLQTLRPRLGAYTVGRVAGIQQPPGTARMSSRPWARLRASVLMSNPLCVQCATEGRVQAACEVDHVVPLWQGGSHDRSNLQPLCASCHADKTAAEAGSRAVGDAGGGIKRI
jgi:5-methylcytosine-specific restriction protein A